MKEANKIYLIKEIFYTLQGEGFHVGVPSIFVRFAQCNLQCIFCDTEFEEIRHRFSKQELENYIDNILYVEKVTQKPHIVFTGGEPTMQLASEELCEGFYRSVETNGFAPPPSWIDWITFSPKNKNFSAIALKNAHEIKFLYGILSEQEMINIAQSYPHKKYCIQLIDDGVSYQNIESYKPLIAFCKKNPLFRLSVQMHKILHIM